LALRISVHGRLHGAIGAACALAALSSPAPAQTQTLAVVQANREAEIGVSTLYRAYQESFPPGALGRDREGGWTPGVAAAASWMGDLGPVQRLYGSLRFAYNNGHENYRGSVFNSSEPLNFQPGLADTAITAELGKGFLLSPRLLITPAAQAGYQLWNRNLGPGQGEDYRAFTAGGAVHADFAATPRLVLRASLGLAEEIAPHITFDYLHPYGADLGARPVYEAGAGLDYRLTRRLHLSADAALSRYGYGRSPALAAGDRGTIFEPASATTDTRLQAGLAYAF
jgi:hypothetical protein